MKFITEIDLNGHVKTFNVDFNYYNTDGDVSIEINTIYCADTLVDLTDALSDECVLLIEEKCRIHYENLHFEYYFMNDRNL